MMRWHQARAKLLADPELYKEFVKETKAEGALEVIDLLIDELNTARPIDKEATYHDAERDFVSRLSELSNEYKELSDAK